MSYTLRQVQPLLTQAELELFQSSRATVIRTLDVRQLTSRVKRARSLRDKYRDLYRRQTVQSRARAGAVEANRRTEVKAEIMDEVLQRFEAELIRKQALAAKAEQLAAARKAAAASKAAAKKAPAKKAAAKKAPAKKAPAKKAASKTASKTAAAKGAAAAKRPSAKAPAKKGPAKTSRAGSAAASGGVSAAARGGVPTGVAPKALRMNPIKAKPINKKIHASARGRQKVHAAKRDSR